GGTSPIHRGIWLLDRVLCLPRPQPLDQLPPQCPSSCDGEHACATGTVCSGGVCISEDARVCATNADCPQFYLCGGEGRCVPGPRTCIPARRPDQTPREYFDSFGHNPQNPSAPSLCHSCHQIINGIGYSLEHFDGIGRFRSSETTSEGDEPIDDR